MSAKNAVFTEEEAKARTCPLTFNVSAIRLDDGTGLREEGPWTCQGSRCMAWRWFATYIKDTDPPHDLVPNGETYGFCGAFGDPNARNFP